MRILSVHNSYQIRGGEDESREAEERLLREQGHQVDVYEETNERIQDYAAADLFLKTIWSQETYRKVQHQLQQKPYDLVHVQNFFPLISPAVHYAAKRAGVPVVQTLRNYRLLCPNALFFRDGQVCEDCLDKLVPYPGIIHSCYRNNKAASATVTAMIAAHRFLKTWEKNIDAFITLTEFSRQKFIEGGFNANKIFVKPNFVSPSPGAGLGQGGYALYVGRLSVEKGIDTLMSAWKKLEAEIPLKIVGEGPLSEQVEKAASSFSHVEWLGRKPMPEVHRLMGEARCLIFPSKWYETFGRVAVESFAKGTPVIASKIGAIAELVDSGRTGIHFEPGNAAELAQQVNSFWNMSQTDIARMREAALAEFEAKFTDRRNYQQLISIYHQAMRHELNRAHGTNQSFQS